MANMVVVGQVVHTEPELSRMPQTARAPQIPETIRHRGEHMEYAGFWRRFGAYWLDFIVLLPLVAFSMWGNGQSRLFNFYYFLPGALIGLLFHVYLVRRYGGTPGKLILKIKIARLDGNNVGYKEAILRYSVLFVLSTAMSIALISATMEMTDAEYLSLGWVERTQQMIKLAPNWYQILNVMMNIWIWGEFITMLTNKKRRAVHDFMAGTVVIRSEMPNTPLEPIP
jgi:uncharacterized RDD family membrane protein YckC